jgi:hypothetical protein
MRFHMGKSLSQSELAWLDHEVAWQRHASEERHNSSQSAPAAVATVG